MHQKDFLRPTARGWGRWVERLLVDPSTIHLREQLRTFVEFFFEVSQFGFSSLGTASPGITTLGDGSDLVLRDSEFFSELPVLFPESITSFFQERNNLVRWRLQLGKILCHATLLGFSREAPIGTKTRVFRSPKNRVNPKFLAAQRYPDGLPLELPWKVGAWILGRSPLLRDEGEDLALMIRSLSCPAIDTPGEPNSSKFVDL